jgi:hypothetical protein
MMPVRFFNGIAGRSIVKLPTGDCVVMHVPPTFLTVEYLNALLPGESGSQVHGLTIYQEPADSPWHVPANDPSQLSTFNCAAYALGDASGLTKSDWLELRTASWTNGLNPSLQMLESHFQLVTTVTSPAQTSRLVDLGDLKPGDVLAFLAPQGFSHFAKVRPSERGNILVSKLGGGPLVSGSIDDTIKHYASMVSSIQIYRQREDR